MLLREQMHNHRNELTELIKRGENSLLASEDDRTRRALDVKLTEMRNELQLLDIELARVYEESFHAFAERMKCDYVQVPRGDSFWAMDDNGRQVQVNQGCFVFSNGAWSSGNTTHREPPEDAKKRLSIQAEYYKRALAIEDKKRQQCKEYIQNQANYYAMGAGPLPDQQTYDALEQFNMNAKKLRKKYGSVLVQLKKLKGPTVAEAMKKVNQNRQHEAQKAMQHANAIDS